MTGLKQAHVWCIGGRLTPAREAGDPSAAGVSIKTRWTFLDVVLTGFFAEAAWFGVFSTQAPETLMPINAGVIIHTSTVRFMSWLVSGNELIAAPIAAPVCSFVTVLSLSRISFFLRLRFSAV
jgi:hypothetical protein